MSDLPFFTPDEDSTRPERKPAKCRRHQWIESRGHPFTDGAGNEYAPGPVLGVWCLLCGKVRDDATSRRAKNNRTRGLSIQREVAAMLGLEHIPGNGPADARDPQFVAEIKSGPAWYSVRVEAELDNLPTAGNRTPIFVAASTPGPGRGRRRVYVTESLGDLVKRVGPHAQVSYWAPEWVATKEIR